VFIPEGFPIEGRMKAPRYLSILLFLLLPATAHAWSLIPQSWAASSPALTRLQRILSRLSWSRDFPGVHLRPPEAADFSPPLPRFLADLSHEWVTADNLQRLAWWRFPNATAELCDPASALWQGTVTYPEDSFAGLSIPADLFANLTIDNRFWSDWRQPPRWDEIEPRLRELSACEAAATGVKTLRLELALGGEVYTFQPPSEGQLGEIANLTARVLGQMTNLEDLSLGVQMSFAQRMAEAIEAQEHTFASIRKLSLGNGLQGLAARCPQLRELEARGRGYDDAWSEKPTGSKQPWLELVRSAKGADLTALKMGPPFDIWISSGIIEGM
jgi:hypothetical protein